MKQRARTKKKSRKGFRLLDNKELQVVTGGDDKKIDSWTWK